MANDQSKSLAVDVIARVDKLEKAMGRAKQVTSENFSAIEGRAKTMTARVDAQFAAIGTGIKSFALGMGAGMLAAMGPMELFAKALETINDASHLVDTADKVGLTTTALQALSFGFNQAGVEVGSFEDGMSQFSKRIGEAATRGGKLADIFKANGVALRDTNGKIKSSHELLRAYAELVKNATSEQEKMLLVTEAFGRGGDDMVAALNDGAAGIDKMGVAAKKAGVIIDEDLLRRAEAMGDKWDEAWLRFKVSSQSAILSAIEGISGLQSRWDDYQKRVQAAEMGTLAGSLVPKPGDVLTGPGKRDKPSALDVRMGGALTTELSAADQRLVDALQKRYAVAANKATIIPGEKDGKGGTKLKVPTKTANDRLTESLQAVQDRIAAMKLEAETTGLVYVEQEKRRMALGLEQEALRLVREEARKKGDVDWENAKLTPEMITKIDATSEAYAKQAEALRLVQEAQAGAEQAASEFYDTFKSGMIDAITGATSFQDALSGILKKLAEMVLNSAFDQLFKGSTESGGALTGIFKALGFADGGFTGAGGKNEFAGYTHSSERVFSATPSEVRKINLRKIVTKRIG